MDKIQKALAKLSAKEKEAIKEALRLIMLGRASELDIKKLKGRNDIFRARIGQIRIIYQGAEGKYKLISIERRSDNTYKDI